MDFSNYRDLLIVNHEDALLVVDVPANEADVGDLVSFEDPFGFIQTGNVVDKMWAEKDGEVYRCIAHLRHICKGVKIYRGRWEEERPTT